MGDRPPLPHLASLGYALFMVVNATQVWGGIFPFLPISFQTDDVTLTFYLSQSISFVVAFTGSSLGSFYLPAASRRMLVTLPCGLVMGGSVCIVAAMYVEALTFWLVLAGGLLLGAGTAGVYMLWQRYFSSIEPQQCNLRLILGTALGALGYFALYLVPIALTAFLVPAVFVPLCALSISLALREVSLDQPMFEDVPREHPAVYRQLARDLWRSALCVGGLGFASGLARGVVLQNLVLAAWVNNISMVGMLAAAGVLLALWYRTSVRFSMATVFRILYPVVMTGLVLFPFVGDGGTVLFTGVTYSAFSLAVLVMMMQCAQISRDRGTNPVFTYGFFGTAAYGMQAVGFLLGWVTADAGAAGMGRIGILSLITAYVLGMVFFLASGASFGRKPAGGASYADSPSTGSPFADAPCDQVEFFGRVAGGMAGAPAAAEAAGAAEPAGAADIPGAAELAGAAGAADIPGAAVAPAPTRRVDRFEDQKNPITDRLSKCCWAAQRAYGLSTREAQIMEAIARGQTVAAISQSHFISENTVRTHSKHIYTKLGIHSKHELVELLDAIPFR